MSPRKPVDAPADQPVILELPTGDRYHIHPRPAEFEGYLAPERVPHLRPGIAPIKVRVTHGPAGYLVTLAPDELEALLRRAQLEADVLAQRPPRPAAEPAPHAARASVMPRPTASAQTRTARPIPAIEGLGLSGASPDTHHLMPGRRGLPRRLGIQPDVRCVTAGTRPGEVMLRS